MYNTYILMISRKGRYIFMNLEELKQYIIELVGKIDDKVFLNRICISLAAKESQGKESD